MNELNMRRVSIESLFPADYNPRKDLQPKDEEYQKLKKSIETFGLVDPVIWNERTGVVVGGHQRLKVLKDLGYKELDVSVVDLSENEEKALNVALNKIGGDWDQPKLKDLIMDLIGEGFDADLTGFSGDELEELIEGEDLEDLLEDNNYTDKIETPNYEPTKEEKPAFLDLYDDGKTRNLIGEIERSEITEEEKQFLILAAYRHVVFDYRNIAEFYAHSSKSVQELMEKSALVIIDFDKAIENGFVEFTDGIMEEIGEGYDE